MTAPVLDDHMHLHPDRGRGIEAVREFARAGGTHLLVVNLPSWSFDVEVASADDFRVAFDRTVAITDRATEELDGRAWPVLGVHPALISRLVDQRGMAVSDACDLMQAGLDVAADYVVDGPAVALKSGRPHYDVSSAVQDASDAVLRHALTVGARCGVPVQLHTEATSDLQEVADWAGAAGMAPERVVKHYADGPCRGVTPSVIARKEAIRAAADAGGPFLMETDYLDDPARPGAVLGPKTVPRRTAWLREIDPEAASVAHVDAPRRVYGIDTEL